MADVKREYIVPLRRKCKMAPRWRRSKRAVRVLREFVQRHMKSQNVLIGNELNEKIWSRGGKKPPGKVKIVALKTQLPSHEESVLVNTQEVGVDSQLRKYIDKKKTSLKEEGDGVGGAGASEKEESVSGKKKTPPKKEVEMKNKKADGVKEVKDPKQEETPPKEEVKKDE